MTSQGERLWTRLSQALPTRSRQSSTYQSVPAEEGQDHAERAEKTYTTTSSSPRISSTSITSRLSPRTVLALRILLFLLIPIAILLVIIFEGPSISRGISRISEPPGPSLPPRPGDPGFEWKGNKTHAVPLDPVAFDPKDPFRKALVLASFSRQHVEWLEEMHSDWEIYRYVLDKPHPISGLAVPRNQGREAMAYLTYIIDHYHDLPNFVVFHHGHRRAWHQPEPTPMKLRALNFSALANDHYINLRCARDPGCTAETVIDLVHEDPDDHRTQAHMLPKFWNTMFGSDSVWDLGPPPTNLSVPCCAQFAVTREAIQSRPLEFWKSYRSPLERDLSEYKPLWGPKTDEYFVGICYEKLWHMVFGKPSIYCPSEDYCRGTQFSDAVVCDRYTGQFDDARDWWTEIQCTESWQDG